jgi:hypothetical protein
LAILRVVNGLWKTDYSEKKLEAGPAILEATGLNVAL